MAPAIRRLHLIAMKNVLLCAFYFAPRNNIASYRTGCFAKYLPEFGWQPTVICEEWSAGNPDYDPDFVGALPEELQVIRIAQPKMVGFYQRVIVRKLMPYLWAHRTPILWWQQARGILVELFRKNRFDATWGTSDPMAPLVLAQEAAGTLCCPWVADLRDSFNVQRFGSWYKRPFFAWRERQLCRAATVVTTVSSGLADVVSRRTGRAVQVIHNGFDPALFQTKVPQEKAKFRLVYAGKLVWPRQNPQPLLQALDSCVNTGKIPCHELEIAFYGSDLSKLKRASPELVHSLPIKEYARVSHREIIEVMQASAVLLLFAHATERGVLTGKLFDYLAAGQSILAIPDDQGDVAALLRATGAGVSLTRPAEIADQLTRWYQAWKTGRPLLTSRNEKEINRYSRREQTFLLAALLNEISAKQPAND
jgi:hypothetical protein